MDWESILATIIKVAGSILAAAAPILVPVLIAWLKKQKIVRQLHLEELVEKAVPQVVDSVEAWAKGYQKTYGKKPSGDEKLKRAREILENKAPELKASDEIVDRIEAELMKRNGELTKPPAE